MTFLNKKGIQIAIGTIVTLFIAVFVFIVAISLVFKWFTGAEELKAQVDSQTEQQIIAALKRSNQLVAIPISVRKAKIGQMITFGVGVRNMGGTSEFSGTVSFSAAYRPDGVDICKGTDSCVGYIEEEWLGNFDKIDSFKLARNEDEIIPVPIKITSEMDRDRRTERGDYVFNVCFTESPTTEACDVSRLQDYYTDKIYQVTVRVI